MAKDDDRCLQLLGQLQAELSSLEAEIDEQRGSLIATNDELASFQEVLERKQGDITLKTLIENEGKRELRSLVGADLNKALHEIATLEAEVHVLEEQMKKFENKDRKETIRGRYLTLMSRALEELEVRNLDPASYKNFDARIAETGSDLPRAIIAYAYSMLWVKKEYGTATFFPIVIDSPNQQDQDRTNHEKLLNFIQARRPDGSQLVLGLVDTLGIKFDGTVVKLTEKYSALDGKQYDTVAAEMRDLTQQL